MLSQTNEDTRHLFLKKFTAELILNSKKIENRKDIEQKNKEETEIKLKLKEIISKPIAPQQKIPQTPQPPFKILKPVIKTSPETSMPEEKGEVDETNSTFDSVKSALLPSGDIDFGKITPFIRDQTVSLLECRRADEKIMMKKLGQTISTEVQLNETEINSLIKAFSEKTRIPLVEGILKARLGNLEIFAVISKFSTSRFIITKNLNEQNRNMINPMLKQINQQNPFASQKAPILNLLRK